MNKFLLAKALACLFVFAGVTAAITTLASEQFTGTQNACVNLRYNMVFRATDAKTNGEVSSLQNFLKSKGYLAVGATGYFGLATTAAIKKFQLAAGIASQATPGYGSVGPKSRAKIKEMTCGNIGTITTTTTSSPTSQVSKGSVSTLPAGCVSTTGYSQTTGQKCSSSVGSNTPVCNSEQTLVNGVCKIITFPFTCPDGTVIQVEGMLYGSAALKCPTSTIKPSVAVVSTPPPVVVSATINPITSVRVDSGSTTVISGTASNTKYFGLSMSNQGGKVWGSGAIPVVNGKWSVTVFPQLITAGTYTVTAYDNNVPLTTSSFYLPAAIAITTTPTTPATPAITFSASPTTVTQGGSTTLVWASANATTCSSNWGAVSTSGTEVRSVPSTGASFTIVCAGAGGMVSKTVAVSIIVPSATPVSPTVTTPTSASVATTTATLGANVTSLGVPATISERGICIGTTPSPITNCLADGLLTTGLFSQIRTGLTQGTLYYFRGYATNVTGTGYSADGTFTTVAGPPIAIAFGVYTGVGTVKHSEGTVNITIPAKAAGNTLVLTAYEPVNWVISNPNNVTIKNIIAIGYYPQRLTGSVPSVPIEYDSKTTNGVFQFAFNTTDSYYKSLVSWLAGKQITLTADNFKGSNSAVSL